MRLNSSLSNLIGRKSKFRPIILFFILNLIKFKFFIPLLFKFTPKNICPEFQFISFNFSIWHTRMPKI
ncbi:hypothetical protein CAMRE0001_1444 [Campylobacter rectus RM3267]|uniref:Uncharacterized protein n=1 Tax=Campylobacter rectus RM3267 TaxID=553218 RepID=B9D0C1_CAMRE|nr:hypothetical protein CAMRE0001_1444 [Campylobacter rectus RM3267]